jgi:hypothetical protein
VDLVVVERVDRQLHIQEQQELFLKVIAVERLVGLAQLTQ